MILQGQSPKNRKEKAAQIKDFLPQYSKNKNQRLKTRLYGESPMRRAKIKTKD
jgi:hypothetical protein